MELVSVVIPLYNTEQYLSKAIESIIAQTYTNWELIICDDGSSDNSLYTASEWAGKDDRIKVLRNNENKGHVYTYNRLFFAAKGEYIMVQDADDWSHPERIAKQVAVLEKHKVGSCLTNAVYYGLEGKPEYPSKKPSEIITINTPEHWAPATQMFRSSILRTIPGFHSYFERLTSMDRYFIMEIVDEYKSYYLEEYLYFVQMRANSDHRSVDLTNPFARRKIVITDVYFELKKQRVREGTDWLKQNKIEELRKYEESLLNNNRLMAEKVRVFACVQINFKQFKEAWRLLLNALKKDPFYTKNYQSIFYFVRAFLQSKLKWI